MPSDQERYMSEFVIENGVLKKYSGEEETVEIKIPKSVKTIGWCAFKNSVIRRIEIPEWVTEIDDEAFNLCYFLEEAIIPDSVKKIGTLAFANCSRLKKCDLPQGVKRIGDRAFWSCASLTEVTVPKAVTEIESLTFAHCTGMKKVVVPEGIKRIGDEAFLNCRSLAKIVIPESVTEIGRKAFNTCRSLTEMVIPEGVERIGELAFNCCSSLKKIIIPDSVKEIGADAFNEISDKARLRIPFKFISVLETKNGELALKAAVREVIAQYRESQESVDGDWIRYIEENVSNFLRCMKDDPALYGFLAERGKIAPDNIESLLRGTEDVQCRAILLEYSYKVKKEKSVDEITERYGID